MYTHTTTQTLKGHQLCFFKYMPCKIAPVLRIVQDICSYTVSVMHKLQYKTQFKYECSAKTAI